MMFTIRGRAENLPAQRKSASCLSMEYPWSRHPGRAALKIELCTCIYATPMAKHVCTWIIAFPPELWVSANVFQAVWCRHVLSACWFQPSCTKQAPKGKGAQGGWCFADAPDSHEWAHLGCAHSRCHLEPKRLFPGSLKLKYGCWTGSCARCGLY